MTTCTIAPGGRSITCNRCGQTSHNLNDVRNRYCAQCYHFHDDPEQPWVDCALLLYEPGSDEPDICNVRLPREPSFHDINAAMLPLLESAEHCEHVTVLFRGRRHDMFVDETGVLKGLPRNKAATTIYRAAWLDQHPKDDPESLPFIAGNAVVASRILWT